MPVKTLHPADKQRQYQTYLKSDHWKSTRRLMYQKRAAHCKVCFSTDQLQVHHKTYQRKGSERLNDLCFLCDGCHGRVHKVVKLFSKKTNIWRYIGTMARISRNIKRNRVLLYQYIDVCLKINKYPWSKTNLLKALILNYV